MDTGTGSTGTQCLGVHGVGIQGLGSSAMDTRLCVSKALEARVISNAMPKIQDLGWLGRGSTALDPRPGIPTHGILFNILNNVIACGDNMI